MKQKEKEIESTLYVPPEVVAVEMQVEQGYELSSDLPTWKQGDDGYWQ